LLVNSGPQPRPCGCNSFLSFAPTNRARRAGRIYVKEQKERFELRGLAPSRLIPKSTTQNILTLNNAE